MTQVKSITSLTLDLPPSCIEFSPVNSHWAVVGTYYLDKSQDAVASEEDENSQENKQTKEQQRSGSLVLLDVNDEKVQVIQTLPTLFAILDIHFTPSTHGIGNLLAAATSTGSIALYSLDSSITPDKEEKTQSRGFMQHIRTIQLFDLSEIVTSLIWHPLHPGILATTISTGAVHLFQISLSNISTTDQDRPAAKDSATPLLTHDLEAWIAAFTPTGTALLTGGDDSTFRYHSLPPVPSPPANIEEALESHQHIEWTDRKSHNAGVTAILPLNSSIVLTGSYDDCIRVLSTPETGPRRILFEENLGGGVWRLKLLQDLGEVDGVWEVEVLASCMHAGARVLRVRRDEKGVWGMRVVARFEEHESMNYGSDVMVTGKGERVVVSTSFYDRLVCVWRIPEE